MTARNSLDLLWGGNERRSRGPKPGLSLERIVRAAIDIADSDGLDAVSMQRVSGALGYGTMSLYRYVPSKDQLLDLMLDVACGPPPELGGEWRSGLEQWVHGLWAVYRRHPWVLRMPFVDSPIGPNRVAWLESALRLLTGVGLRADEMIATAMFLDGAVREQARITVEGEHVRQRDGRDGYPAMLRKVADPERYPVLAGLVSDGVFDGDGTVAAPAAEVDFGLRRLLDGIESYVRARA